MTDFWGAIRVVLLTGLFAGCVLFIIHILTRPKMLNDADTQAKRILLWQEALTEMSPEERQLIEVDPKGWRSKEAERLVQVRLEAWSAKRNHKNHD